LSGLPLDARLQADCREFRSVTSRCSRLGCSVAACIGFIRAATALLALSLWICQAAPGSADAGDAPSPFPDPPGYHRPVAPPEPEKLIAKPGPDRPHRPWVKQPSPALATRLRGWRVKFVPDKAKPDPARGVFPSFSNLSDDATVRLVNVQRSAGESLLALCAEGGPVPISPGRCSCSA
jgi:hypothetical protein